MDLIIVESPTKAKTLGRFLGDKYQIEASMGHVRDLPEKKLGIDVESGFTPQYEVPEKKKAVVGNLREAAKRAEKIILATDPDREGEAITWHIAQILSGNSENQKTRKTRKSENQIGGKSDVSDTLANRLAGIPSRSEFSENIQRITFHEITEQAIKEALQHPGEINMPLVEAQTARRILDRLVGYKLSPLLWRKVRRGLSAGRVQSVAVRLIVEREREIQAFKPEEYWEVTAQLSVLGKLKTDNRFEAKLVKIDAEPAEIKTKDEADRIVRELGGSEFRVKNIEVKEVKRYPYPPFTTSTLQQAASNLFGWSAKRTMQIAQGLYEQGLITYHRTDSLNLAISAVDAVRRFIGGQYGKDYLPEQPRFYKIKSKAAQEAHEAIRPTGVESQISNLKSQNRDGAKLYELIWKRFVACQMKEAVYEQTGVDIEAHGTLPGPQATSYLFKATGSRQIFDGWRKLYDNRNEIMDSSSEIKDRKMENGERELPVMAVGDALELLELLPSQHFTEPPARFTEASLIKALEEYGIGRPSTYAPIISTIQERQYVEKMEKKFQPTNLGLAVNDFLLANFTDIMDYQFTAGMEDKLDDIANGERPWRPVVADFYGPFAQKLSTVQETAERVKVAAEETSETCPQCQAPLVVRLGRFGKFLACSKFPACKFTKPYQQKINMKCPGCGTGDIIIRRTRSRKSFYGCSRYPECDFASWTKPKVQDEKRQDSNNGQASYEGKDKTI